MLKFLAGVVVWAAGQVGGALSFLPHTVGIALQAIGGLFAALGIHGASTDPATALTAWLNGLPSGWKTVVGALVYVVGALLSPDVFNKLSPQLAGIVQALGGVLAALGLYHSTAKAALAPAVKPNG